MISIFYQFLEIERLLEYFMRLAERDKKRKYLKLIPYAWKMIDTRM